MWIIILLYAIGFSEAYYACLEFYFEITFPHSANEVLFLKIKAKAGFSRLKKAVPTGLGAAGLWGMWMQERESAGRQLERFSVRPARDDGFGPCPSRRGGRTALDGTEAPPAPADPWVGGSPPEHGARAGRDSPFHPFPPNRWRCAFAGRPPAVRAPPSWAARGLASPGAKQ